MPLEEANPVGMEHQCKARLVARAITPMVIGAGPTQTSMAGEDGSRATHGHLQVGKAMTGIIPLDSGIVGKTMEWATPGREAKAKECTGMRMDPRVARERHKVQETQYVNRRGLVRLVVGDGLPPLWCSEDAMVRKGGRRRTGHSKTQIPPWA